MYNYRNIVSYAERTMTSGWVMWQWWWWPNSNETEVRINHIIESFFVTKYTHYIRVNLRPYTLKSVLLKYTQT